MEVLSESKRISDDISNITTDNKTVGSSKIKNVPKSLPRRKNVKRTQSSTLENWLTKDVSQKSLGHTRKSHNKKFCGISSDDPNGQSDQLQKSSRMRLGEYSNVGTDTDSMNRDEKKQKSSPRSKMAPNKKHSVNNSGMKTKVTQSTNILDFKKVTDKNSHKLSASQEISHLTDTEITPREKKARKKFRKILTSPMSASFDGKLNKKSQTDILSLEPNGEGCNRSGFKYNSTNKKADEKDHEKTKDNVSIGKTQQAEGDGVTVTPTKQMKSSENLRRSPRHEKSPKSTPATSVAKKLFESDSTTENKTGKLDSKCYGNNSRSSKSKKTAISPKNKFLKKCEKVNVPITGVNKETEQAERNTPTKQMNSPENLRRSPRHEKSPKPTPATSVAKKLFHSDSITKNETGRLESNCDATILTAKEVDVTVTSPRQKKSAVNLKLVSASTKSSKPTRSNSGVKKICDISAQNDEASTAGRKSSTSKSKIGYKGDNVTSRKSKKNTASPMIESNKITKYYETNMPTTANNTKTKETKQDVTPTKKHYSAEALRPSPRATSAAKQLSSSFTRSNNKLTCVTKDSLRNKDVKQTGKSPKQCTQNNRKGAHKTSTKYKKLDVIVNSNVSGEVGNEATTKTKAKKRTKEQTSQESNKRKLPRSESNEGSEFPSFRSNNKKLKTNTTSESFKKYGVTLPSVEEILKEQEDFLLYKNQVESFEEIDDKIFELPFSVKDLKNVRVDEENVLGCKHLSMQEVEEAFHKNFDYTSAIFHGEKYSERHERFFEANVRSYEFTTKDLCYNTSTIVFSFEQREHLLMLLKKRFDPEDKWTSYFFKVLLPELCLKIFMDTHCMEYNQAVKYLDTRPILDD